MVIMENIKKKNILIRIAESMSNAWKRLGEADIDDNDYEGITLEQKAELTKRVSALDMLKPSSGKKANTSIEQEEIYKKERQISTKKVKSRDDGFEIGEL